MNKKENYCSKEHLMFLKSQRRNKLKIVFWRISAFLIFLILWELAARYKFIDSFLVSSPSRVLKTLINLNNNGEFWSNILVTVIETTIGFIFGTILGVLISIILWWFDTVEKISEPYLIILNALPKVALGPIIIVWMGSGTGAIITMSLLISVVVTVINILSGFKNVDENKLLLMRSFGASKFQILQKIILPTNFSNIISTLKINVGMSLIGVITGEFLVATKGIGYLIIYGGQVFKLDLVVTGIFILAVIASLIYIAVAKLESYFTKFRK
ncbi:MAG: ABC transporter permease [Candidatus Paraimprobicoccus trichonymphae]|uniref:ABC transporter permease n=1 Tax=Candidatus Paraimprobicoccus trichonymphae TaxID=3033793 RepID=A0AA48KZQ1_9FIRM|nr:MAG: ABC transporter permease [Candidatus Paraimprobicoccus trichonymphae]